MTTPDRGTPPSHIAPAAAEEPGKPEAVRLFVLTAIVMLCGEVIHQMFSVAAVLLDPSAMIEQAKQARPSAAKEVGDANMMLLAYASVGIAALFALAIVVVLAIAVRAVAKQASWAENALKSLMVFGGYFALRVMLIFAVPVSGSAVPTPLIALDGAMQIIAGVAGVCAIVFATQDEVRKWTAKPNTSKDAKTPHGPK